MRERDLGRTGEYALEEGGILELDGELLEAGKVSWGNIGCSCCIIVFLQEHLLLTIVRECSSVLSYYGWFCASMLASIVSVKG